MKGLLIAIVAFVTLAMLPGTAFAYKALAMTNSGNGWGWAGGGTMEQARQNAILQCELANGRGACNISVSEHNNWYFAGVWCAYNTYVAASPQGYSRAEYLAFWKADIAGDYNCSLEVLKY